MASAGTKFQATTTLSAETANNTSAADSFVTLTDGDLGAGNVSKMATRSLLYPGSTAKIYAHLMPWFGTASHMNVGYASNDSAQVQKQVNDMVSRGLDGTIVDWYGPSQKFLAYDQATQYIMQQAQLHPGFNFAIMYDQGALNACASTAGCDVTQTMISDLNYANATYWASAAYMKFNGRPVLYFFVDSSFTIDWTRVRSGVAGNPIFVFRNAGGFTHAQSNGGFSWVAPETASATDPMALLYLDNYYKTALGQSTMFSTGSGYKGFNDSLASWGTNRFIDQQCGQTWLKSLAESGKYYSSTNQMLGVQIVTWNDYEEGTEIESGIDNCVSVAVSVVGTVVSWSITGQVNTIDHYSVFVSQDGQNLMWLADAAASATQMDLAQFSLNSGNYIAFVKATGRPSLSNKMSAGAQVTIPNLPPTAVLSVTPNSGPAPVTVTASTVGSTDVDGSIASTSISFGDGSAAVNATSASHTYSAAGTYTVSAVVTDNLGASSTATATVTVISANKPPVAALSLSATSAYAPASITASTAGSSDPDGTVVSSSINWGDGSAVVAGPSATHSYATPGSYTVTATVTDNSGASSSTSSVLTVLAPQVIIATPANSATVNSPVHVVATGYSGNAVTTMQIYLDGTLVYQIKAASLDTSISASVATHRIAVKGWDSTGKSFLSAVSVNVVNAPPVAVLSVNPTSGIAPVTVSASTAGSSDQDGTIASTTINFGDGSAAVSATSATHTYSTPGAYVVTATVTDNLGASSSATSTVNVIGNQPPTAALSLSASSIVAGGSITASTTGSTDADGSIAASSIDFGDGTIVSGSSATHQYKTAATYTVKATVTDNLGASSSTNKTVTVNPRHVIITSPTFTSTSSSSVLVSGTAYSGYTVTATQVYLDGTLKAQVSSTSISTSLNLGKGTHQIVVKGWDAAGSFMASVTVTRQ